MALRTSVGTGNWSAAGTWDTGVPVDTDTFAIAAGHTVTFDVDQSGMGTGMGASSIANTGQLTIKDDGGTYYLKMNGDLTLTGTLQAGTSAAVPFTGTFTIDFNSGSNSIVVNDSTGSLLLYCSEPTNKYVTMTAQEAAAETEMAVDTDVSSDWSNGDTVVISDLIPVGTSTLDNEENTIAGMTATTITLTGGLANQKEIGAHIVLITRNIRLIDSTDYAIKGGNDVAIYCEVHNCIGVCANVDSGTIGGSYTTILATKCYGFAHASLPTSLTFNAAFAQRDNKTTTRAFSRVGNATFETGSIICGFDLGLAYVYNCEVQDIVIASCIRGITSMSASLVNAEIQGCRYGLDLVSGSTISGDISNAQYALYTFQTHSLLVANCELGKSIGGVTSTADMYEADWITFYNTLFSSTAEYSGYNSNLVRGRHSYTESFDHDQVANAYKAWCLGGIVTSQTDAPPTGYDRWYEHACEYVSTGSYPCFRQFKTVVQPGEAIEVIGEIRIAGAEDLSADPPALQIIDIFADPLIDSTQSPLVEDEIPVSDGSNTGWQDVAVIWANAGDSPRTVYVRMYASVAGVTANVDVDEVWSIASYKDQISDILKKVKRLGPTGEIA
jgi:hypothetical protein